MIKPIAPLPRLIREGTIGDCPLCSSSTKKKFFSRKIIGCIQPKCLNYYKRSDEERKEACKNIQRA